MLNSSIGNGRAKMVSSALAVACASLGFAYTGSTATAGRSSVQQLERLVPSSAMAILEVNLQASSKQKQISQLFKMLWGIEAMSMAKDDGNSDPGQALAKAVLADQPNQAVGFWSGGPKNAKFAWNSGMDMSQFTKSSHYGIIIPIKNRAKIVAAFVRMDKANMVSGETYRGAYYHPVGTLKAVVLSHAVLLASDTTTIGRVIDAGMGKNSLASLSGLAAARARYDSDANIVLLTKGFSKDKSWGGAALTLRDTGLSLVLGPFDAGSMDKNSLAADYASGLPTGAYAFFGLANQDPIFGNIPIPGLGKGSLNTKDLGDITVALYPSSHMGGAASGVDALLEMTSSKHANPVRSYVPLFKMLAKQFGGGKQAFVPLHIEGATMAATLSNGLAKMLRTGMMTGLKGSNGDMSTSWLNNKTISYATIGKSLLVATSKDLIKKAVAAAKFHRGSLANDHILGQLFKNQPGKTNFILAANLSAIGDGLVSMLGSSMSMPASIMKSSDSPAYIRLYTQSHKGMAKIFIPITPMMIGMISLASSAQNSSN